MKKDKKKKIKQKLWSSCRALGSRSEDCGFESHLMLDESGVKAMPGSIPTPNSGSLEKNKKIQVAKWGTPKNILKKNKGDGNLPIVRLPWSQSY